MEEKNKDEAQYDPIPSAVFTKEAKDWSVFVDMRFKSGDPTTAFLSADLSGQKGRDTIDERESGDEEDIEKTGGSLFSEEGPVEEIENGKQNRVPEIIEERAVRREIGLPGERGEDRGQEKMGEAQRQSHEGEARDKACGQAVNALPERDPID